MNRLDALSANIVLGTRVDVVYRIDQHLCKKLVLHLCSHIHRMWGILDIWKSLRAVPAFMFCIEAYGMDNDI